MAESDLSIADLMPIMMTQTALVIQEDVISDEEASRCPCIMLCGATTSGSQLCRKTYCDSPGASLLQVFLEDDLFGQYDATCNTLFIPKY